MAKFAGIWPALVTPLDEQGRVHVRAVEDLVEALVTAGVSGLYVCGGTGEGILLRPAVRREMAEVAIAAASGRVPVMVHVGALDTETAIELGQHANLAGADAISAVPPFYYEYPFSAIKVHYAAIAAASGVPLYAYYIPGATGNAFAPEQLLDICAMEGIGGFKYTSRDLHFLSTVMARRDAERVNVLSGPDELFSSCVALGVDGAIGTTYNFMPRLYIDILHAMRAGDVATARELQFAANRIIAVLLRYGVIPGTRALLNQIGFRVGQGVPPMPPIVGDGARALQKELDAAGLGKLLERPSLYGPAGDSMRGRLA